MLNVVIEKLVTHYLMGRLLGPLAYIHALTIGYRTEIATVVWVAAYLLEHYGIMPHDLAQEIKLWSAGAGGLAFMDKMTRYAPVRPALMAMAKVLEEEKKNVDPGSHP